MPRRGRIELATARSLQSLEPTHPAHDALAASALNLARALDEGAGLATAAVARELRATVTALTEGERNRGDDRLAELLADLRAPVGNTP